MKNLLDVVDEQRNQELSANSENPNRLPYHDRSNQNDDRGKIFYVKLYCQWNVNEIKLTEILYENPFFQLRNFR